MFKILIKKDINNSISLQEKAEAIGLGDKYNMLKNFMKSWYFNLGRTGIIWSVYTLFIVYFMYKGPIAVNYVYVHIIAFINDVQYLGTNIASLSNLAGLVITLICCVALQYILIGMSINILELVRELKHAYFMRTCVVVVLGNLLTFAYGIYALMAKWLLRYSLGVVLYTKILWIILIVYSIFSKIWIDSVKQSEKSN